MEKAVADSTENNEICLVFMAKTFISPMVHIECFFRAADSAFMATKTKGFIPGLLPMLRFQIVLIWQLAEILDHSVFGGSAIFRDARENRRKYFSNALGLRDLLIREIFILKISHPI